MVDARTTRTRSYCQEQAKLSFLKRGDGVEIWPLEARSLSHNPSAINIHPEVVKICRIGYRGRSSSGPPPGVLRKTGCAVLQPTPTPRSIRDRPLSSYLLRSRRKGPTSKKPTRFLCIDQPMAAVWSGAHRRAPIEPICADCKRSSAKVVSKTTAKHHPPRNWPDCGAICDATDGLEC